MKKLLLFFLITCHSIAPAQLIQWQKCLGGTLGDLAYDVRQTLDGGHIVAGTTESNDGDVTITYGDGDFWVIKLSPTGAIQWQKTYGGSEGEYAKSIQQTSDGGYIVAGVTYSNDGDITGAHGNADYWVIKLSATGSLQWQRALGGSGEDLAKEVRQTPDGGYIVVGQTSSGDGDVSGPRGATDGWVVKLSALGSIEWEKCYGGSWNDELNSVCLTNDGGYILAGETNSIDSGITGVHGTNNMPDCWLVRLAGNGNIIWQKCYGGSKIDIAYKVRQTSDGGFAFISWALSINGDITGAADSSGDCWVVKLSSSGSIIWEKSIGGSDGDGPNDFDLTDDDGFIIIGSTISQDRIPGPHQEGYWIFKLSSSGGFQWQRFIGGSAPEGGSSIQQTFDGGYIVGGYTLSNDGDVSGNHGKEDAWIVKLGQFTAVNEVGVHTGLNIAPNPAAGSFTFQLSALGNEAVNVVVTNMLGVQVHQFTATTNQQQQVAMPAPPAIYFITATTQSGTKTASKIVVQ